MDFRNTLSAIIKPDSWLDIPNQPLQDCPKWHFSTTLITFPLKFLQEYSVPKLHKSKLFGNVIFVFCLFHYTQKFVIPASLLKTVRNRCRHLDALRIHIFSTQFSNEDKIFCKFCYWFLIANFYFSHIINILVKNFSCCC